MNLEYNYSLSKDPYLNKILSNILVNSLELIRIDPSENLDERLLDTTCVAFIYENISSGCLGIEKIHIFDIGEYNANGDDIADRFSGKITYEIPKGRSNIRTATRHRDPNIIKKRIRTRNPSFVVLGHSYNDFEDYFDNLFRSHGGILD